MAALPAIKQPEPELSVAEVADLKGCSQQYIRKLLDAGELTGYKRLNERNLPAYYIPVSTLPAVLQMRYRKGEKAPAGESVVLRPSQPKSLESFNLAEQEEIAFWSRLLEEWRAYRQTRNWIPKAEADEHFILYARVTYQEEYQQVCGREFDLSIQMLTRRWRSYRENDLQGLVDERGKMRKGKSSIDPLVWDAFLSFYLDEAQHPVSSCLKYTQYWVQNEHPELYPTIPSLASFYRRIGYDIPEPLKVLGREGEKAYRDRCGTYIKRIYDDMESNEYWIADTHTLDIISNDEDGRQHRLYLVAFFDARSQIFVGCQIANNPSSQATLSALRKCIQRYGIPKNIYVDNGREFLTRDVGGLGHRARKKNKDEFVPPPIFERLGITMINALVRNARAKTIERQFLNVKNQLSRLFPTFTGGNVTEKPEQLKYNLKAGKIVADKELTETVELLLHHYFNEEPYGGAVVKDRGKTRMQVYDENLHEKRIPRSEDDLNLLMMRSSRVQKVGRRGVNMKIGGVQYDYFNEELVYQYSGKEVYYRYDPEDMTSVRVYDLEGNLLTVAPVDSEMMLKYGASKEDISNAMRIGRKYEQAVKLALSGAGLEGLKGTAALELIMAKAKENQLNGQQTGNNVNAIYWQQVLETPLLDSVVGLDNSIETMLSGAENYYKGGFDDE